KCLGRGRGSGGEKISIVFPTMVEYGGKIPPGRRVRTPPPKGAATVAAAPKPAPSGNGAAAAPPQPQPPAASTPAEQLDEFGQSQSADKPSIADDLDDEVGF